MRQTTSALATLALLAATGVASAQQAGDWTLGFGVGLVNPQSDTGVINGANSTIDDDIRPTFTFEYFIADNIGIEVLAATPFQHSVSLAGLGEVVDVTHLPPTVSLNYHFTNDSAFTPFVGAGVNYTWFLDSDAVGALAGNAVDVEDSFGLALNLGFDYALSDRSALRMNVRWIDINADVIVNGANVGTAEIDPWVFGVSYVLRF